MTWQYILDKGRKIKLQNQADGPMKEKVLLEWTYTPKNYFEEHSTFDYNDYQIDINNGQVTTSMLADFFDSHPNIRQEAEKTVENIFLSTQVFSHQPFNLSGSAMVRVHPDGRRNVTLNVQSLKLKLTGHPVDLIYTNADGVVHDTRAERIKTQKCLVSLAEKTARGDAVAKAILDIYNAAVNDPSNELVHLYEIRDALAQKFHNSTKKARQALNISRSEWKSGWNRLGQLANDKPLKQGRHRGKHRKQLRDATPEELQEARDIARNLIIAYLQYSTSNP